MILTDLSIHHLRNISQAHIPLHSRFTFIVGPNGSGKTSVLEALYLLSCGHSFRSREISPLISNKESTLTVFSKAINSETISIQKSHSASTLIKLNHQFCKTTSELAYALPAQIVYSDLFNIIDAGPSVRRSVLDWGLFHVKHRYLSLWKEYKRVLKQRNALLRSGGIYSQFIPWDNQLCQLAYQLDQLRQDYFACLQKEFTHVQEQLTDAFCTINYFKGWDKKNTGLSLEEILQHNFNSDRQRMFTQSGAHQADILFESNASKAKQILSRGQQKIVLMALKLAQGILLDADVLYLFDDYSAELDETHRKKLFSFIKNIKGQFVFTSTQVDDWAMAWLDSQVTQYTLDKGQVVGLPREQAFC